MLRRLRLRLLSTPLAVALLVPATAPGGAPTGQLAPHLSADEEALALFFAALGGAEDACPRTSLAPEDRLFAEVSARLADAQGPLLDTDLEVLSTIAGLEALLVNDAPGTPEDQHPRGFFGPRPAPADRFVVLVVPTIDCAPLLPDPTVGLPPWHAASPEGGTLAALFDLWVRRGLPPATEGEAALCETGGDPWRLRQFLAMWLAAHWHLSPAALGLGNKPWTFAEMYAWPPAYLLPG